MATQQEERLSPEQAEWLRSVGDRIARARGAKRLSQRTLAKEAGVDMSTISRIETGRLNPAATTLSAIGKALGLTFGYLAGEPYPLPADSLATLIRHARIERGLSIEAAAQLCGVPRETLDDAEVGKSIGPAMALVMAGLGLQGAYLTGMRRSTAERSSLESSSPAHPEEPADEDALLEIARHVELLDDAMRALLDAEALPEKIRDVMRERLGPRRYRVS